MSAQWIHWKLYTVITELHMLDEFFRYWTEKTADCKTPPNTDKLIELLQSYRLRLQGRTINSPPVHPPKQKLVKSANLHVQKEGDCALCHYGNHPLYMCTSFKAKSVDGSFSTTTKLKVCTNCLSFKHLCRDCPSHRSCSVCGKRHHSLLHRQ